MTQTQDLAGIIDNSRFTVFAVRALHVDEDVAVGDTMADSYVWDDGERTEESIGGTCGFEVRDSGRLRDAIERATPYDVGGDQLALLGGTYTGNNDLIGEPHAIAIRDAVVLAVWARRSY